MPVSQNLCTLMLQDGDDDASNNDNNGDDETTTHLLRADLINNEKMLTDNS